MKFQITENRVARMRIGNAGGTIKTLEDVQRACASDTITDITVGSITTLHRRGNEGVVYWYDPVTRTSCNSLGLPNQGLKIEEINAMRDLASNARERKRLRVSIAAFSPAEYGDLAYRVRYACHELEVNLGCPNVWSTDGTQKPIVSYDPKATREVLRAVQDAIGISIPVAVKISPIPDEVMPELAEVIREFKMVTHVVAVNTQPGYRPEVDSKARLRFKAPDAGEKSPWLEVGGMAGMPLKPEMLRVVAGMRKYLPIQTKLIAVGGIFDGSDIADALEAGAVGIQSATAWLELGGPRVIRSMSEEVMALVPAS